MPLTVEDCTFRVKSALGGSLPSVQSVSTYVNDFGTLLATLHPWNWLRRTGYLDLRAPVALTGATWNDAAKTLTQTGAFANYPFLGGDSITLSAGTGATLGRYVLASKPSDNSIVLETSIGSLADGKTNIQGTLENWAMALPADCDAPLTEPVAVQTGYNLALRPMNVVLFQRSANVQLAGNTFVGSIQTAQLNSASQPVMRLEHAPMATANTLGAFSFTYRAKFRTVSGDDTIVSIPDFLRPFFLDCVALYARSIENNDKVGFGERLTARMNQIDYLRALQRDGVLNPVLGPSYNNAIETAWAENGVYPEPFANTRLLNGGLTA